MRNLIEDRYGINITKIARIETGAGSDVFKIDSTSGTYLLKKIIENNMNNPYNEPDLISFLEQTEIPIAKFIRTKDDKIVWTDNNNNDYHMQEFVGGITFKLNSSPDWFMRDSARLLGKIHHSLSQYKQLPDGIGEDFIKYMTTNNALKSYKNTIRKAETMNNSVVINDIEYRMNLLELLAELTFNLNDFTRGNSHGDYFISQIICDNNKIKTVIDWTTACYHPICWEIIRSFAYSHRECFDGTINIEDFKNYISHYLKEYSLNKYDLKMMPYLYFYQLGVCDYYGQYFNSDVYNKNIILKQATHATNLLRWFENNIVKLSNELVSSF